MIWFKILDFAIMVIPLIAEFFKRRRGEGERAADYVRRNQAEKLKTTELILEERGPELSRLARSRLRITRELLRRAALVRDKSSKPPDGGKDILPKRFGVSGSPTGGGADDGVRDATKE